MSYVKLEDVKNAFPFLERHKVYVLEKWWIDKMLDLEVPKADVAEVKHGHWIDDWDIGCSACSECDDSFLWEDFNGVREFDYCPTCGAKMDEVTDGTPDN